ncbi:predicted protein [Histoplasma capsulatum var. duboisii H88]|uniref:Predicted protein n=1 Tax=Ajellomyces capsulatus (strain H88) TaxID=544711 RepID=F0UKQ1_AJEC8|nr:predicted protein [Histoplasma capsulatum var. duboisii H88]
MVGIFPLDTQMRAVIGAKAFMLSASRPNLAASSNPHFAQVRRSCTSNPGVHSTQPNQGHMSLELKRSSRWCPYIRRAGAGDTADFLEYQPQPHSLQWMIKGAVPEKPLSNIGLFKGPPCFVPAAGFNAPKSIFLRFNLEKYVSKVDPQLESFNEKGRVDHRSRK